MRPQRARLSALTAILTRSSFQRSFCFCQWRRSRLRTALLSALAAILAIAGSGLAAGAADASHDQTTFFEAPAELLDPATRQGAIQQLQYLGVNAIRVDMSWGSVAPSPEARNQPSFQAGSPGSYDWGEYGELIEEAHSLHWQVLLTVGGPAPRWATSNGKAPYVTRPNPHDFEQFMAAVARRFGGEVSLFAIWNEPNEFGELQPQFARNGEPVAGRIYRGLFQAGYEGLKDGGLRNPKVLMGETAPGGFAVRGKKVPSYAGVAPITFLQNALCLNSKYVKNPHCGTLPAFGYAQHPYVTNTMGPFFVPKNPNNVTIGSLGRLVTALNRAGKAHAVRPSLPIFLTEFGVMSKPNRYFGVSWGKQAEWDAIAERIAWEHARVYAFSQYLLEDDPLSKTGAVSFQTGLETASGVKKPLYFGFPVPLTVTRTKHGYALWGFVRPAHKVTEVTILVQRSKHAPYTRLAVVKTGSLGYWQLHSNVNGRFWRVRWISPSGVRYEGPPIK